MIPILPNRPVRNVSIANIKNTASRSLNVYLKEATRFLIVSPIVSFFASSFLPMISFADAKHTQKQGTHTIENTSAAMKYPLLEEAEPFPKCRIIGIVTALITIWIRPEPIPLNAFKDTRSWLEAVITLAKHCVEMFTAV